MNKYLIIDKKPNCVICGEPLKEWNPFVKEHEHLECISKRITNSLIKKLKEDLNK